MIYDARYQMTDLREGSEESVSDTVQFKSVPGGLLYFEGESGMGKLLTWDDDDPDSFVDDELNGVLIITTETGSVMFQKLAPGAVTS